MKKSEIMSKTGKALNKVGFQIKKYSPEILITLGVVGAVASTVMACKATLKVNEVLDKSKTDIDDIHEATAAGHNKAGEEYTSEDGKKDLTRVYLKTGVQLVKLYGPAVTLGALSIGSVITSNHIIRQRNMALAAAYATVDKSFKNYRKNVVERFGEEVDHQLKYNIKATEVEETVVDEKTGKETTRKTTLNVVDDLSQYSEYAKFFDVGNDYWEKDAEHNLFFLKRQERYANDLLKAKGRLFLNEVYDMLGLPRTKAGQVVGWRYDPNNPNIDSYVEFGIFDVHKRNSRDFVNGYEPTILLDFNVDGDVWSDM